MSVDEINMIYVLIPVLLIASVCDVCFRKIPNWLTLSVVITILVYHATGSGINMFFHSLTGTVVGLLTMISFYSLGGLGGGDVKLMGAVGAVLGPKWVFVAFMATGIIGGIYTLFVLALRGHLRETVERYRAMFLLYRFTRRLTYIPPTEKMEAIRLRYGVAIAFGAISSVFIKSIT